MTTSLEKLVNSWNNRSGGKTNYQLTLNGDLDLLPEPLPVNIYRIVQECLTNVAKHAQASRAEVSLSYQLNQNIFLEITDDGIAEAETFDNTTGVGLLGIRERVTALGGELTLIPSQTSGLAITIFIPVQSKQAQHP